MIYPGYQDASYFHDEKGFIAPTPYGDVADCILSDCPLWLLKQYPVLVISDKLQGGNEIKDKLDKYVESGGHLIITAGSLENMPGGLSGITAGTGETSIAANSTVSCNNSEMKETSAFKVREILFPAEAKTIATCKNRPLVVELNAGSGKITVFATPFGLGSSPQEIPVSKVDTALISPFPLLNHVQTTLSGIFRGTEIFNAGDDLSLITCSKSKGEYTVAITNNSWIEKPFKITSKAGNILNINELPINCSEQKAIGFTPKSVVNKTGKNTAKTIAGGDVRIFNIKMEENNIGEMPFIKPVPNPANRGLTLRNISSIKEEILLRPTFFQHFDRVIVDWKYLLNKEKEILAEESGWISRQGLKIIVDFSTGLNLFPDLRLIKNDTLEYERSMGAIKNVIDKMAILGAGDLILTTHRTVENNFKREEFYKSMQSTIKELCQYSEKRKINVNLRMTFGRNRANPEQILTMVSSINEVNLYVSPAVSLLLGNPDELEKNLSALKNFKVRLLFVAAPEKDSYGTLWNINKPISGYGDKQALNRIFAAYPESAMILDGIYADQDEEYLDIKVIENR